MDGWRAGARCVGQPCRLRPIRRREAFYRNEEWVRSRWLLAGWGIAGLCPAGNGTDARAARLGIKSVAHPDGHFVFRGERKNLRMYNLRPAGGERVGIVVTKVVQQLGFRGLVRIGS